MKKKSGKTKFIYLSLVICLLITVILAGCTKESGKQEAPKNSASSGPVQGGTLKMLMSDSTTNIGFPAELRSATTLWYSLPVVESLGRYDQSGKSTPWLAESWQTDAKAKTITFKLKQGIKFHDGTDFNADAVKWNIEQYQKTKRPEVEGIQSMDVIDANTLRLNLTEWDSDLLDSIAYLVRIISPAAVAKNGKDWAIKNPVGTGPFKFVSWERDISIKFIKNENYWQKGKPHLDAVEYSFIEDRNTAANVFKTEGADVLARMEPDTFLELQSSNKYVTNTNEKAYGASGMGLMFDSVNPNSPFANVKVRQAVMHAVDSEAIANSVLRGLAVSTNQFYTSSVSSYNPDVKGYPFDPEKAKQLLAEAGFPNGFKTKITTDAANSKLMTAVQAHLAKVGIDAQIVTVDAAKWSALIANKWDGMILYGRNLGPSPVLPLKRVFSKDAALYAKNIIHPDKVEKLIAEAKSAPDYETMKKTFFELQKVIIDEYALYHPLVVLKTGIAMQPNVQNLGMFTSNGSDWTPEDVWKKK